MWVHARTTASAPSSDLLPASARAAEVRGGTSLDCSPTARRRFVTVSRPDWPDGAGPSAATTLSSLPAM